MAFLRSVTRWNSFVSKNVRLQTGADINAQFSRSDLLASHRYYNELKRGLNIRFNSSIASASAAHKPQQHQRPGQDGKGASPKDPLDLSFNNPNAAFKSKTTGELLRAYVVYLLCSSTYLVDNNLKINSKYSAELAEKSLEWIKEITSEPINTSGDPDNFFEVLKDGVLLCKLINCIKTGSIKKVKRMENITAFLDHAKQLGVPPQETFQSVDLWERQNLNSVVICLQSLGRKANNFGFRAIGPKEADKNVRNFSDEMSMEAGFSMFN